jgi:hypothetical protein
VCSKCRFIEKGVTLLFSYQLYSELKPLSTGSNAFLHASLWFSYISAVWPRISLSRVRGCVLYYALHFLSYHFLWRIGRYSTADAPSLFLPYPNMRHHIMRLFGVCFMKITFLSKSRDLHQIQRIIETEFEDG